MRRFLSLFFAVFALALFAAPEGKFDWSTANRIDANIRHAVIKLKEPRLVVMQVVKVRVTPKMFFMSYPKAEHYGEPMPDFPELPMVTLRTRVADFMNSAHAKNFDMVMAVNASPWDPWTKPFNHKYAANTGLSINLSEVVELPKQRPVPALVVTKDNQLAMRTYAPGDKVSGLKFAVSGFSFVLQDGKTIQTGDKSLAPRTLYGLSQDAKTLYIIVADGRQKEYSMGLTVDEGGEWLQYLGAHIGINMDGGGSSTLCFWDKQTQKAKVMNQQGGNYTRPVGNAMGICYRK